MKPTAGLAAMRSTKSTSGDVEMRISFGPPSRARARARSNPLSAPSAMSTSTTSGCSSATRERASAEFVATPTTSICSRSSSDRAASRNPPLSSTITQRRDTQPRMAPGGGRYIAANVNPPLAADDGGLRGGLTRRTVAASAALVLVIGAAFAVLVLAIAELRRTTERSTTSQEVLSAADTLERLVIDLETGARGYIITRDERFLAPWHAARTAMPRQSGELERLATGTVQHARAQRITGEVASYLRDYSVPLVEAVRRHETTGRSLATTAAGQRRLDRIRGEFARFVTTETGLARTRQDDADEAARRAGIAVTAGLAGAILLVLLYAADIVRSIVRPVVGLAAMAGRLAGGDLAVRTPEDGTGEIGGLQRSFHDMARSLEASRD